MIAWMSCYGIYQRSIILRKDKKIHYRHLEIVLSRRQAYELYGCPKKCELFKDKINFLDMLSGTIGIKVNLNKSKMLGSWPRPSWITDIRIFLGLLQLLRPFIPNFAEVAEPSTGPGVHNWHENRDKVFQKVKTSIIKAPFFIALNCEKAFQGHSHVSQTAVGRTLIHLDIIEWTEWS